MNSELGEGDGNFGVMSRNYITGVATEVLSNHLKRHLS